MEAMETTEVTTTDLTLPDGRTLTVHDTGPSGGGDLTVVWHHGTPNTGRPPAPLFAAGRELGVRWVGVDRPGYGGSTPAPGRPAAATAADTAAVADHLGLGRVALLSHSGGGPHALAGAALMPERVSAVAVVSSPAPRLPMEAEGHDWYAGFASYGEASLRAAAESRAAREAFEEEPEPGDFGFTAGDEAALGGEWAWFLAVVREGMANGPGPAIDDDLATVSAWEVDVTSITVPTLVVHGDADRVVPAAHGRWLATHVPGAQLWLEPDDGHIGVLHRGADALRWLRDHAVS